MTCATRKPVKVVVPQSVYPENSAHLLHYFAVCRSAAARTPPRPGPRWRHTSCGPGIPGVGPARAPPGQALMTTSTSVVMGRRAMVLAGVLTAGMLCGGVAQAGQQADKSPGVSLQTQSSKRISVADAARFIGQSMWVCGDVIGTRYDTDAIGRPTFIELGHPSTPPLFTVVIWDKDRGFFPWPPEAQYRTKDVCVSGRILSNKGQPTIIATSPKQIEEQPKKKP